MCVFLDVCLSTKLSVDERFAESITGLLYSEECCFFLAFDCAQAQLLKYKMETVS